MTAGPAAPGTPSYGWRIGRLGGVPVYIGRSYPVFALAVVVFYGSQISDSTGTRGGVFGYAVAVAYALILLFSVLVHEGAHAFVARRFGHRVDRMVADIMGGHTVYQGGEHKPGSSAAISIVGPLSNLVLAAVGYGAQGVFPDGVAGLLLSALAWSNLLVGILNLLPGLPLDGGFVVEAVVWKITGSKHRGLIVAGWAGRVLTVVVITWVIGRPLLNREQPSLFLIVWGGLIGAFLWAGASNAIKAGTSGQAMARVPLMRVLRPVAAAGVDEPLADVLRRVGQFPGLVVAWDRSGRAAGLVDLEAARAVDPDALAAGVTLAAVVARQPDGWVVTSDPRADVTGVIDAIVSLSGTPAAMPHLVLVLDLQGRPLGSVSLMDLDAALQA